MELLEDRRLLAVGAGDAPAGITITQAADAHGMFPGEMFDVGDNADDMTMADFNEDGHPDIACVNRVVGFSVLLGRGNGTFEDRVVHDMQGSRYALASGDIDGDGHVDLVTGSRLFRGIGDGSFADPVYISVPNDATDIVIEDVDQDGAPDVVAVNWHDRVYLLPGRGDGAFESRLQFEVGDGTTAVSVIDLNQDGHLDLVTANGKEDDISVLLGQGNRVFAAQQRYAVGEYPRGLETADVNQDNITDLIVSDYHEPGISVLLGKGDGTFLSATQHTLGTYPNATLTYDINRDGAVDLLVADSGSSSVLILRGNGDGTFLESVALPTGDSPYEFALADFNQDGQDDLGVLCWGNDTFAVHLGQPDGPFQFAAYWSIDDPADSVVLADFNNDGHLDLATSAWHREPEHHSTVSFRFGFGNGQFGPASSYDVTTYSGSPTVGDFNEDGFVDLVVASGNWLEWSILLNQGDGTFEVTPYDTREQTRSLTLADFNGDGHLDLLGLNVDTASLDVDFSIHLGDGNGSFQFAHNIPLTARQYANEPTPTVVARDFNADGKVDLAMGPSAGEILVFLGVGNGTFGEPYRYQETIGRGSLALGDFNEDGHTDLIGTRNLGSFGDYEFEIVLLLNHGDGTFVPRVRSGYDHAVGRSMVADVNGDGHADLIANSWAVEVLLGDGNGEFSPSTQYAKGSPDGSCVAGDLNEDGRVDFVVGRGAALLQNPPGIPETGEAKGAVQYSVVLDSEPAQDVTVTVTSDDETEGTVSPAVLVFTPKNWDTPQSFTISGADDDADDGDATFEVLTSVTSADSRYDGLSVPPLTVTNLDDDEAVAGVSVVPLGDLTTSEEGDVTAQFTVALESEPIADVTLAVASDDETEGTTHPPTLIFTAENWDTPRSVTISGLDDDVDDGDATFAVLTSVSSADSLYDGIDVPALTVTNLDDDTAGITVSPTTGLTTSETGTTATFTVVLDSEPTEDVTIGITSNDTTEGTVSPAVLVFVPKDWDTPQSFTINAVDDGADDGDAMFAVLTSVASADSRYDGLGVPPLTVTNLDDDEAGLSVVPLGDLTTSEAGDVTAQFTIALESEPIADVTLAVTSDDETEGTAQPATLVFTAENWDTPRGVTISGLDDDVADGDATFAVLTSVSSADSLYDGMDVPALTVTNLDDDTAGITVSPTTGLTTSETGTTATFTVVLDSEPTADVTIGITSDDTTEGTVSDSELLFTPANWNQLQTVTVSGVDDASDDDDMTYTIVTATAVSDDPDYGGLNAADVSITNNDDDTLSPVELGSVDFTRLESLAPSDGDLWFQLVTAHDAWLTVQTVDEWAVEELTVRLFDPENLAAPAATSTRQEGKPRLDHEVQQGQTYLLQVTGTTNDASLLVANLVHEQDATITVHGTSEPDVFAFDPAASRKITINGIAYHYEVDDASAVEFDGGQGRDVAWLYDSAGNENLEAWPDRAYFANSTGGAETDFTVQITGIEDLLAYATRGGSDFATFHGSEGADKLKSYEDSLRLRAKDSDYTLRAKRFGTIIGDSGAGGNDLAVFNGTDGNETFTYLGAANAATLQGKQREHTAAGFGSVTARAGKDGNDVAHFTDIPGTTDDANDFFYFKSHKTQLVGSDVKITVRAFDQVYANASQGGFDVARIYDTTGDDHLEVAGDTARLYRRDGDSLQLLYEAVAFERAKCYSTKGDDTTDIGDHVIDLHLFGWDE